MNQNFVTTSDANRYYCQLKMTKKYKKRDQARARARSVKRERAKIF